MLNNIFSLENRAVYEIKRENSAQPERPQMTILPTHIASWIPKATSTHSEYVTFIAFPLQQWFHERVSVLRSTFISCLVT
jgi:phosphatidylinositol kinase/protein kinase (PI-3  family)